LIGAVAQRLVRILCPACREPYSADASEKKLLQVPPREKLTLYRAAACAQCNQTGYSGRTGIYELVVIDDGMKTMIHEKASEHLLEEHARRQSASIRADGRAKVLAGVTTLDEVLRVTRED
jgi:general secretion pathway protein E